QELGLSLNVWTVNSSEAMDLFLNRNVDYITTDEPELLLSKKK
ncbi:MAG: glycerophosphodiester phosphodiesterase, partial [Prevotellaceae bacterium]|nr:glycerophosphodiester phosphodiesterase [Prevotellaceae bacterium]